MRSGRGISKVGMAFEINATSNVIPAYIGALLPGGLTPSFFIVPKDSCYVASALERTSRRLCSLSAYIILFLINTIETNNHGF